MQLNQTNHSYPSPIHESDTDSEESFLEISKKTTGKESASIDDTVKTYLKQIGQVKLLSKTEEIEISMKVLEGNEFAKQQLINANLRLVVSIAKKYTGRGILKNLIRQKDLNLAHMPRGGFARQLPVQFQISLGQSVFLFIWSKPLINLKKRPENWFSNYLAILKSMN
jgi:hypothetical protein